MGEVLFALPWVYGVLHLRSWGKKVGKHGLSQNKCNQNLWFIAVQLQYSVLQSSQICLYTF